MDQLRFAPVVSPSLRLRMVCTRGGPDEATTVRIRMPTVAALVLTSLHLRVAPHEQRAKLQLQLIGFFNAGSHRVRFLIRSVRALRRWLRKTVGRVPHSVSIALRASVGHEKGQGVVRKASPASPEPVNFTC